MTTQLRYPKGYQFFTGAGAPLALGTLTYYAAGSTTLQNTFADSAGAVANANPLTLDASGRLLSDVYLSSIGPYKEVLAASGGTTVSPWPDDNIPAALNPSVPQGASLSFTGGTGTVAVALATAINATFPGATGSAAGAMSAADKAKLDGLSANAFTGDTGTGGAKGLVPAPNSGDAAAAKFLKADGTWSATSGSGSVPQMGGATGVATGTAGLVPAPPAGQQASFLRGDAAWAVPSGSGGATNITVTPAATKVTVNSSTGTGADIPAATASAAGVMTATDRATLSGLGTASTLSTPFAATNVSGIPASLAAQNLDNVARVGIGTTDASNKLSVSGPSSLFSNSADVRFTASKGAAANTAAFVFQDAFSTRAQIGLLGNDSLTIQTSPDGAAFNTAIVADSTGKASFPNSVGFTGDSGSGGAVGLVPAPAAGKTAAGAYLKADGTWAVPPGTGGVTNNSITNAFLAQAPANTIKGNNTGALANEADLTASQARALLKVDQRVAVNDAAYAALSSDTLVSYTAITVSRVVTLPAASSVNTGAAITIVDESGACSATKTISAARAGADTINGAATSAVIAAPYGYIELVSNGTNGWTVIDTQVPGNFTSTTAGLVPLSGGGTTNFLRADGTFAAPAGGGGLTASPAVIRDSTIAGFTGAQMEIRQAAAQSAAADVPALMTIPVANSEAVFAHIYVSSIKSDFSVANNSHYVYGARRLSAGNAVGIASNLTSNQADVTKDSGSFISYSVSVTASAIVLGAFNLDAGTHNLFVTAFVQRLKTNT